MAVPSRLQLGVVAGYALKPLLIHSPDTNTVCDHHHTTDATVLNGSASVDATPSYDEWSETIYWQLFWYLLGQAVLSVVLVAATFFGEIS